MFSFALAFDFFSLEACAQDVQPVPDYYKEPGLSPNRDYINQQANEHIDPFNGKLQLHYVDLFIPGNGGLDIKVQRSYTSLGETLAEPTGVGVGWTMHFGRVLRVAPVDICASNTAAQNAPVLELPDGSRQILYLAPGIAYNITLSRWRADCSPDGLGLIVSSPDGIRYEMTTRGTLQGSVGKTQQNSWYTTRIVDRNGNTLNIAYQIIGKNLVPVTLTASDGRQLTFTYSGNNLSTISDGSRTWTYTYQYLSNAPDYPFLSEVQRPDGNKWKYTYNLDGADQEGASLPAGTYSIASVTYPTGSYPNVGTVTYQYGFVTFNNDLPRNVVITQKNTLDPGGMWTFTYTPATTPGTVTVDGADEFINFPTLATVDLTVVTGPDGTTYYEHAGANSVVSQFTFMIGCLLVKGYDNNLEVDFYSYTAQEVSPSQNIRPGGYQVFDFATYAPLTTEKTITRNDAVFDTQYSNFDAFGNPQTVLETGPGSTFETSQNSRTTTTTYASIPGMWILHLPQSVSVDIVPGTISYSYDAKANLLSSNRYGVTTQYTYLPTGDMQTKQDALGNTVTYNSYMRGIPQSESQPEGVSVTRTVDSAGNVTSETDGEGVTIQYAYDSLNRLTSVVHPIGNPVTITWLQNERDVQRGAYLEKTIYDGYGHATSVEHDGGPGVTSITQINLYDALSRKIFTSYPNQIGNPSQGQQQTLGEAIKYDVLGRAISVMHVAAPINGGQLFTFTGGQTTTTFTYNLIETTDETGRQTLRIYRAFGDPEKMVVTQINNLLIPDSNTTITRNGLDQIVQVDQDGKTRTNTYDSHYYLTQSTDPEIGTTVITRDNIGNMLTRQVGSSGVTSYTYDGRNRLATITYPSGTPGVTHTYYKDDLAKSVDNGVARRDYTYTPNKKMQQETLTTGGQALSATYAYDSNDAMQSVTYSTGLALAYNPDAFGRPTQATPFATGINFFPNGQLQGMQYANGTTIAASQNARLWPGGSNVVGPTGNSLLGLSYVYENNGNISSINEAVRGINNRSFGYDPLNRLTTVTLPNVSNGQISYDGRGNILSQNIGAKQLTYQYDPTTDLLTGVTGTSNMSFTYDVYGNVTANSRNQFTYNDALNMTCVDCGTQNEIDYVYDGTGTRVSETKAGVTTYFMYGNGGNLLFEQDSTGVKREYGYVAGRNIAKKETRPQ
jgi:YD repeat-containing protein